MIDVQEHIYDDDPQAGHPDVRTYLRDTAYFFLGNGLIQAVVQSAPSGEGTPLGLLIQDAEKLGKKREASTMDRERGLEPTQITIETNGEVFRPIDPKVFWLKETDIPMVAADWTAGPFRVRETFFCPRNSEPLLVRKVVVSQAGASPRVCRLRTGNGDAVVDEAIVLPPAGEAEWTLAYRLDPSRNTVAIAVLPESPSNDEAAGTWSRTSHLRFQDPVLDHLFQTCARQLPAVISRTGRVDASIWQYNREWVRDHSFMSEGLTLTGNHEKAGVLLRRLLTDFVSDEGDCLDSSERRAPEDVELDQNGALLQAVKEYVLWSGDRAIVSECWDKIRKTAEFPLRPEFRHAASGLLANRRDYWERHAAHGIEPGLELMYQIYPSLGLAAASDLARLNGKPEEAGRWLAESARLKEAVLSHPIFRMVDEKGFIKRRSMDGSVQATIQPRPDSGLPDGVPLAASRPHFLQPDVSTAMPIALGFIPADGPIARSTLAGLEELWNQDWSTGGYGRYHFASEADCSGPWPVASLVIARACLEAGDTDKTWRVLRWLAALPSARAGSWFELHGNRISPPYAQIGLLPWTWAEMATLFIRHIVGLRVREEGLIFRPRLLPGMGGISGSVRFREHRLLFDLRPSRRGQPVSVGIDGRIIPAESGGWSIPYKSRDVYLDAVIPES